MSNDKLHRIIGVIRQLSQKIDLNELRIESVEDELKELISVCSASSKASSRYDFGKRKSPKKTKKSPKKTIKKSPKKVMKEIKEKKVSKERGCTAQKTQKYMSRPSPPYPANECCGQTFTGNDGERYTSKADKNGTCKWIRIKE